MGSHAGGFRASKQGSILILELDRPRVRNAIDLHTAQLLERELDAFEDDPDLRVAVLTGSSDYFCAGQDLASLSEQGLAITPRRGPFGIMRCPPAKPIIAAVEGKAFGGGFELALSCDLIVAARNAQFGLPEVKLGLLAAAGGLFRLPRRLPYHFAMEMILTGAPATAASLQSMGVISRISEPGHAKSQAIELAKTIAENAPLAVVAARSIACDSHMHQWSDEEGWTKQGQRVKSVLESRDAAEGMAAFWEKRRPNWTGK